MPREILFAAGYALREFDFNAPVSSTRRFVS
jgi:hypothetical protein